jgi:nitrate reductase NapAB chaperone NapD
MRMAGTIVTAAPGQAEEVARCLGRVRGIRVLGVHEGVHVVLVAEAFDEEQLENLSAYLRDGFDGVEAVRMTIVGTDDAAEPGQATTMAARAAIEFLASRGETFGEERR